MTNYNENRVKECWKEAIREMYDYNEKYINATTPEDREFYDTKQIHSAIEANAIIQTYCLMTGKIYDYVREEWIEEVRHEDHDN